MRDRSVKRVEAEQVDHEPDLERARSPARRNVFQSSSDVLIDPTLVTPKPSRICCALANASSCCCVGVGLADRSVDQRLGIVDEQAIDDLAARRSGGRRE